MNRTTTKAVVAGAAAASTVGALLTANLGSAAADQSTQSQTPVSIEVFAPGDGDNAGVEGKGWFVDLEADFRFGPVGLRRSGFNGSQLTGPGAHADTAPFPGLFGPGQDEKFPGLVVLTSTTMTNPDRGFQGPGTNLAGLFNLTGITDRSLRETEIWDTWIVGDSIAGIDVNTTLTVAVVADLNGDRVYNDAPDVVTDLNGDGRIDARDLQMLGVASNIETIDFHINGATAP